VVLEVDVEPLASSGARLRGHERDDLRSDALPLVFAAMTVSTMNAWTPPSHGTFTKPTSSPPSRAQTQPRLCPSTCPCQSVSNNTADGEDLGVYASDDDPLPGDVICAGGGAEALKVVVRINLTAGDLSALLEVHAAGRCSSAAVSCAR
jgi:hypothetical protein